ncbi:MAG: BPSS1780 family membrane protein [Thiohalomonadaceae bacterium]
MNTSHKVVYTGALKAGTDVERFVQEFARAFKVPEAQARKLVDIGKPVTLKTGLDGTQAEKFRRVLVGLGMEVRVESSAALSLEPQETVAPTPATAPAAEGTRCPKCGSSRVEGDDCLACGIIISRYRERQARLAAEAASQAPAASAQTADGANEEPVAPLSGPRRVPAGNGWQWIADGWGHFRSNPFAWLGAVLLWMVLLIAVSIIPIAGPIAMSLLAPVFIAGFFLGADHQREGEDFRIAHLFAGFSRHPGKLVLVGVFELAGMVVIGAVAAVTMSGSVAALPLGPEAMDPVGMLSVMAVPMLLTMTLMMLMMMAYWYAPALVALDGLAPLAAMKLSFVGCLKNVLPLFIYSVAVSVLLFVAMLPLGLGMLVMAPLLMATMYTSYRDIFHPD